MLNLTPAARDQIAALIAERDEGDLALRVAIAGRFAGNFQYKMGFVDTGDHTEEDVVVEANGFQVYIDPTSAPDLEGATMDYIDTAQQKGFKFDNPNPVWSDPVAASVQKLLDEEINPSLASHRGFVVLVEVKDATAYVAFGGACQGCGMIDVTLKEGVEARITEEIPEIEQVVDTTDHSRGEDPRYG